MTVSRFQSTEHLAEFGWGRVETLVRSWIEAHRGESGAAALAVAFDLDSQYPASTLMERRRSYAQLVERSTDTVAAWEDKALRNLARWLAQNLDGLPQPVRSDATIAEYRGYVIEYTKRTMHFDSRRPTRAVTDYTIRAVADNVTNMRIGAQHLGDRTTTAMEFTISQGRLVSWTDVGNGAIVSVIEFPRPLMTGDTHEFRVDRTIDTPNEPPPFYSYTAHTPTGQLEMNLQFGSELPGQAWTFRQIPFHTVPYRLDGENALATNGDRLEATFHSLSDGLSSGIGWTWA